jgi:hypothetical protein
MKENCFVRFTIEGEDGIQYGIHNPEANIIMCACCGGIYTPGEDAIILETAEIGLEAYDAIMDVFNEHHLCNTCAHITQETTDDVACCNCCEDNSFYSPMEGVFE